MYFRPWRARASSDLQYRIMSCSKSVLGQEGGPYIPQATLHLPLLSRCDSLALSLLRGRTLDWFVNNISLVNHFFLITDHYHNRQSITRLNRSKLFIEKLGGNLQLLMVFDKRHHKMWITRTKHINYWIWTIFLSSTAHTGVEQRNLLPGLHSILV